MTAKRFTINDCRVLSSKQILKILNQLVDENEQLKEFKEQNISEYIKLKKVCNGYKKENEQLKHRLAISEKANFVTVLEKENEQLKKQLVEKERMLDVRDKIIADVMKAVNGDLK